MERTLLISVLCCLQSLITLSGSQTNAQRFPINFKPIFSLIQFPGEFRPPGKPSLISTTPSNATAQNLPSSWTLPPNRAPTSTAPREFPSLGTLPATFPSTNSISRESMSPWPFQFATLPSTSATQQDFFTTQPVLFPASDNTLPLMKLATTTPFTSHQLRLTAKSQDLFDANQTAVNTEIITPVTLLTSPFVQTLPQLVNNEFEPTAPAPISIKKNSLQAALDKVVQMNPTIAGIVAKFINSLEVRNVNLNLHPSSSPRANKQVARKHVMGPTSTVMKLIQFLNSFANLMN